MLPVCVVKAVMREPMSQDFMKWSIAKNIDAQIFASGVTVQVRVEKLLVLKSRLFNLSGKDLINAKIYWSLNLNI